MIRARFAFAATLVASLAAGTALAQAPGPEIRTRFSPARTSRRRCEARPTSNGPDCLCKREKNMVIDEFTVKNISTAPIARLTIEAIFYDKGGAVIAGGKSFVNGLLQPRRSPDLTVETPYNAADELEQLQVHARQWRRHAEESGQDRGSGRRREGRRGEAREAAADKKAAAKK